MNQPRSGFDRREFLKATALGGAFTANALSIAMGAHPKSIQARMGHSSVQVTLDRYGHRCPELDAAIATGLDASLRTALRVVDGGLEDTPRTQRTRGGHKMAASRGISRALAVRAESGSDQPEHVEAASGIEPVYRALQEGLGFDENGV